MEKLMPTTRIRAFPRPPAHRLIILTAALLLTVSAAACSSNNSTATQIKSDHRFDLAGQKIRIGTAAEQTLDIGSSYAVELLKSWGADVDREELTDVSGIQAIVADRIDVSARSSDEVIDGQSRGVNIVAFGAPASAMHYVLIGSPSIKSVADLKGHSIATSGPGGFDTNLFDSLLKKEGLSRGNQVKDIPIGGSGERMAAVMAGQADASMVFLDDWLSLQAKTDSIGLIAYIADLNPGLSARTFAATRAWLDGHKELATAVACANLEANQWINNDEKDYVAFTTGRVKGATDDDVEKFRTAALKLNMFPTDPAKVLSVDAYRATEDVMRSGGTLDKDVDVNKAVDTSYLQEAAKQGCGQGK
jgi:NitT/TauT family transport system substrate-binding protein